MASSIMYASFYNQCFLSKAEIQEVALGLEVSGQPFIFVFIVAVFGKGLISLPTGFKERIWDRGLVLKGWEPQKEITVSGI